MVPPTEVTASGSLQGLQTLQTGRQGRHSLLEDHPGWPREDSTLWLPTGPPSGAGTLGRHREGAHGALGAPTGPEDTPCSALFTSLLLRHSGWGPNLNGPLRSCQEEVGGHLDRTPAQCRAGPSIGLSELSPHL